MIVVAVPVAMSMVVEVATLRSVSELPELVARLQKPWKISLPFSMMKSIMKSILETVLGWSMYGLTEG